jgi:hypothetical protein
MNSREEPLSQRRVDSQRPGDTELSDLPARRRMGRLIAEGKGDGKKGQGGVDS